MTRILGIELFGAKATSKKSEAKNLQKTKQEQFRTCYNRNKQEINIRQTLSYQENR